MKIDEKKYKEILLLFKRFTVFFTEENMNKLQQFSKGLSFEFSPEEVRYGLNYLIQTRKYTSFPTYAEIRESCNRKGLGSQDIEKMIDFFNNLVITYGTSKPFNFTDNILQIIVNKIGFSNIIKMDKEELKKRIEKILVEDNLNKPARINENAVLIDVKIKKTNFFDMLDLD